MNKYWSLGIVFLIGIFIILTLQTMNQSSGFSMTESEAKSCRIKCEVQYKRGRFQFFDECAKEFANNYQLKQECYNTKNNLLNQIMSSCRKKCV